MAELEAHDFVYMNAKRGNRNVFYKFDLIWNKSEPYVKVIEDVAEVVLFESASRPRKRTSKAVIPLKAPLEQPARKPHQEARPASSSGQSREEAREERMGMQHKKKTVELAKASKINHRNQRLEGAATGAEQKS